ELGGGAGLLVETADVLGVGGHLRGEDLQRDGAVELAVAGAEDRRHAADADRLDQFEVGEAAAAQAAAVHGPLPDAPARPGVLLPRAGAGRALRDDGWGVVVRPNPPPERR